MSLDETEKADRYQALASEAYRDGGFRHAHNLRAPSRSMNQLAFEGEPILSLAFDARAAATGPGSVGPDEKALRVTAGPYWMRCLPGVHVCPKMAGPGLDRAEVFLNAEVTDGARVYFQVETLRSSLDYTPSGRAGRTFEIIGTGAPELYSLADVPIDSGLFERFGFWIRGERTGTVGDTGVRGDNDGQIELMDTVSGLIVSEASTWNYALGDDTWAIGHVLLAHDGPDAATIGNPLYVGQIVGVPDFGSVLCFRPPDYTLELFGKFFKIYELPQVRLFSIDIYLQDG